MINKALFSRSRIDEIPKVIPGQKSACRKFSPDRYGKHPWRRKMTISDEDLWPGISSGYAEPLSFAKMSAIFCIARSAPAA